MARTTVDAVPWPAVGGLVRVAVEGAAWAGHGGLASRVEDVAGSLVAIAAPTLPDGADGPAVDDELELRWATPRGLQLFPVRLIDRGSHGGRTWWCELAGSIGLRQRRAYVRAQAESEWPVRVVLHWSGPSSGSAEGVLVDLSEGGLRARVEGWPGGDDVRVSVSLALADGAVDGMAGGGAGAVLVENVLSGTALREDSWGGATADGRLTDVGVQFEQPVPAADELRALVFAWQRAERRAGLG